MPRPVVQSTKDVLEAAPFGLPVRNPSYQRAQDPRSSGPDPRAPVKRSGPLQGPQSFRYRAKATDKKHLLSRQRTTDFCIEIDCANGGGCRTHFGACHLGGNYRSDACPHDRQANFGCRLVICAAQTGQASQGRAPRKCGNDIGYLHFKPVNGSCCVSDPDQSHALAVRPRLLGSEGDVATRSATRRQSKRKVANPLPRSAVLISHSFPPRFRARNVAQARIAPYPLAKSRRPRH